jgi:hypothetical protein
MKVLSITYYAISILPNWFTYVTSWKSNLGKILQIKFKNLIKTCFKKVRSHKQLSNYMFLNKLICVFEEFSDSKLFLLTLVYILVQNCKLPFTERK